MIISRKGIVPQPLSSRIDNRIRKCAKLLKRLRYRSEPVSSKEFYERTKSLLEVVNAALNKILAQEQVTNKKIAPNSQVSKNYSVDELLIRISNP